MASDWVYLPSGGAHDPYYYANVATGETQWERPPVLDGAPAVAAAATPKGVDEGSGTTPASRPRKTSTKKTNKWVEYMDETHNLPYYYNEATGESTWVLPADDDDDDDDDIEEPSMDEAAMAKKEKREKTRAHVLEEILSTERTYVGALHTLKKVYLDPLRMVADAPRGVIFSHVDLDSIFLNIDVIAKVNDKFLEELQAEGANYAEVIKAATRQFKGCYTRYVNNYDDAEAKLRKIRESSEPGDREKNRYLNTATSHPDAKGEPVSSFLIKPIQRVLKYRLLLAELDKHTDPTHPDKPTIAEAYERVCELAQSFNEDKRLTDDLAALREVFGKFREDDAAKLRSELMSYDRKILREGALVKVRVSHRQKRHLFLFSDYLVYAAHTPRGYALKGRIPLHDGARVESLPKTDDMPFAFAIIERGGKGYTWICESAAEKDAWYGALADAIKAGTSKDQTRTSDAWILNALPSRPVQERVEVVRRGSTLTKYNKADGKSKLRWVYIGRSPQGDKIHWGDQKTRKCESEMKLGDATALIHGAKSQAFFKQKGSKTDQDWQCFSIVFKERTLDFAATNVEQVFDWYLALAHLMPQITEPLLGEDELRTKLGMMGLGSASMAHWH